MAEPGREGAIIIKKKKGGGHAGSHGGAWKVAYADFVTAMMAFFIVMWILASSEKVKEEVAAYFKDPGAFNFMTGKRTIPINLEMVPEKGKGQGEGEGKAKEEVVWSFNKDDKQTKDSMQIKKAASDSVAAAQRVAKVGKTIQEKINEMIAQKPDFADLLKSIKIEINAEGLKIELIEKSPDYFYEVGSANLKPKAVEILKSLAGELGKMPNNIEIQGHTDARPYGKLAGYTNFDLSADRANAARRILERSGLYDGQVAQVSGYADTKLAVPESPYDFHNRRVSIVVRNMTTKQFITESPVTNNPE